MVSHHVSVVLHLLCSWGGLVTGLWPHLQLLYVGLFWCVCCAVLSAWLLVAPSSFSCASLGFFLWSSLDLGLVGCGPAWFLPSFGGELSFPCPGCFRLAVSTVWLSRLLEFFLNSFLGFFLSLPVFADSLGWLRIVLYYPPSVAWRRCVLPWFSVRALSGCLSPAVFMIFAMGLPVSDRAVFFLSPRSSRSLSLLLVGLVPGLSAGSPTSGWRCVLGMRSSWWLSLLCIPSGCGHPLGH